MKSGHDKGAIYEGSVPTTHQVQATLAKLQSACFERLSDEEEGTLWAQHLNLRKIIKDNKIDSSCYVFTVLKQINREEAIKDLVKHCEANGADVSSISIGHIDGTLGYGIKASVSIPQGGSFLKIPQKLIIRAKEMFTESPLSCFYGKDRLLSSMENVFLAFALILEVYKGPKSEFWPYLQTLPCDFNNVLSYSVDEMEFLRGSPSFRSALNLWGGIVRQYSCIHSQIIHWTTFCKEGRVTDLLLDRHVPTRFCLNDYFWAVSIVMSRNFLLPYRGDNTLALVPLMDLCNHDAAHSKVHYDVTTGYCLGLATYPLSPGSHIYVSYGDRTGSDYVLCNGFLPERISNDCVKLCVPFSKNDKLKESKRKILGVASTHDYLELNIGYDFCWGGTLLGNMRIMAADKAIMDRLLSLPGNNFMEFLSVSSGDSIFTKNETTASLIMISRLKSAIYNLESLPNTSLALNNASSRLSPAQVNINSLKLSEKSILENALKTMLTLFPVFST